MRSMVCAGAALFVAAACPAAVCRVDFSKDVGKVRPELHSSGFGLTLGSPAWLADDLRTMNFTAARTHDWALINDAKRVCDYFHIFPLMHLDAKDPKNYHFGPTDRLLKLNREKLGVDLFYRLGTSIESGGPSDHFNALIPKDFDKVAEIFAGTVRHYNKGWADGFEWNIRYWEIWNEPEGGTTMWCIPEGELEGADEETRDKYRRERFVAFFVTCLKRLKSEFPDIKVGGPALENLRRIPRRETWLRAILAGCRDAGVAPDFLSWHYYDKSPDEMIAFANRARRLCDEYGFTKCELILDEWHFFGEYTWKDFGAASDTETSRRRLWEGPGSHNGIDSSCFNLAFLSLAQTSVLSQAYFYGCRHEGYWGYRDGQKRKYKIFHGLRMFGEFVRDYDVLCASSSDTKGVRTIAGRSTKDPRERGLIVTDYRAGTRELSVEAAGLPEGVVPAVWAHDATRDFEQVPARIQDGRIVLPKADAGSAAFLIRFVMPEAADGGKAPSAAVSDAELTALVGEDLDHVIRPGKGTDGWWNAVENGFMYPPAFGFTGVKAALYRYTLVDDRHDRHVFYAPTPQESLKPIWPKVPVGMCTLVVDAVDEKKESVGLVGQRTFWKRAAFKPGAYPSARRSYAQAATMFYDFLFASQPVRYLLEHGETDPTYLNNSYPTKMNAAIVQAMVHYAARRPDRADEALKIARAAADYLIAASEKPGTPLAGCPPTYETRRALRTQAAEKCEGMLMMCYPASAGSAYLDLFKATGERKYRDAAVTIADVYLRLQGEDGTWPLMVYLKDARAYSGNRLSPIGTAGFLERVATLTGEKKYRDAADRAIAWEDVGPMKTFNWNGQFEDANARPAAYANLSFHEPTSYALFLLDRFPGDAKRISDARELLRFGEDLFVYWERPSRDDGTCIPQYPKNFDGQLAFENWCVLPGVGEQHNWNVPIDSSAGKMIRVYLALYRATGNPLDLAKAKALGDSITRAQFDNGDIPTHWTVLHMANQRNGHSGWLNCGVATAMALEELAEASAP